MNRTQPKSPGPNSKYVLHIRFKNPSLSKYAAGSDSINVYCRIHVYCRICLSFPMSWCGIIHQHRFCLILTLSSPPYLIALYIFMLTCGFHPNTKTLIQPVHFRKACSLIHKLNSGKEKKRRRLIRHKRTLERDILYR